MNTEKQATKEIKDLQSLRSLAHAYAEIASLRMKKNRQSVLVSRDFLAKIEDIFEDVRQSYIHEKLNTLQRGRVRKGEEITVLAHNGKTVCVLLSANTGFYGDIVKQTFELFSADIQKIECEVTIVGKLGLSLFLEKFPNQKYSFFRLPDSNVIEEQLSEVIRHLVPYEKIRIYYGKFKNAVDQEAVMHEISAEITQTKNNKRDHRNYVFEPNIEKIMRFFETEIFASLFEQTIRESELAKLASRVLSMDTAEENIKKQIKIAKLNRLKIGHMIDNKKQQSLLSSIRMWNL